jgi:methionine aminopeptidase
LDDKTVLREGDVVKIDLGVHLDGYIVQIASTHVVNSQKITGRIADVISAAHFAAEAALRLLKPGHTVSKNLRMGFYDVWQ